MPEATPDTTMDGPQRAAAEESPPVTIQREHDAVELVAARREIESLRAQQRSQAACLDDVIAADELSRQQQAAMHEKLTSERARRLAAEEACSSAEAACSRLTGQLEAEREKSASLLAELSEARRALEEMSARVHAERRLREDEEARRSATRAAARMLTADLSWALSGWVEHTEARAWVDNVRALDPWLDRTTPALKGFHGRPALSFEMTARDLTDQMHAHCVPCRCARVRSWWRAGCRRLRSSAGSRTGSAVTKPKRVPFEFRASFDIAWCRPTFAPHSVRGPSWERSYV